MMDRIVSVLYAGGILSAVWFKTSEKNGKRYCKMFWWWWFESNIGQEENIYLLLAISAFSMKFLKFVCCKYSLEKGVNFNLFLIQTLSDTSAADAFWKHCDKRRNCWKWAIFLFATIFSTFCSNHTFIYRDFPVFCKHAFKVGCCRFVVCGKGLNSPCFCFPLLFDKSVCYTEQLNNERLGITVNIYFTNCMLQTSCIKTQMVIQWYRHTF